MIKNVIFDMDGVIRTLKNVKVSELLPDSIKQKYEGFYKNSTLGEIVSKYLHLDCFKEWDKGTYNADDVYKTLLEQANEPTEVIEHIFAAPISKEYNIIFPETLNLIKSLRVKGYKLFVLSNMGREVVEVLNQILDMSPFEDVVFSCDVGLRKPDPKFYKYALDRWDINPAESIFVDDNPKNLPPFENLDVKGFLFDSKNINLTIENLKNIISNY